MAFARRMMATMLVLLAMYLATAQGAACTTGEGCRSTMSCKTGGTVYCCPGGERLEVNGTSGVCNCNAAGSSGLSCSGGAQIGQGSQLLPTQPGDSNCETGATCASESSCNVEGTSYCCPGGFVTTVTTGGTLRSCSCRYDVQGSSCTTRSAAPNGVTSASALTCAVASLAALVLAALTSKE